MISCYYIIILPLSTCSITSIGISSLPHCLFTYSSHIVVSWITQRTICICSSSIESLTRPLSSIWYWYWIFYRSYRTSICRLCTSSSLWSRLMSNTVYFLIMSSVISSTFPAPSIVIERCVFIKSNY